MNISTASLLFTSSSSTLPRFRDHNGFLGDCRCTISVYREGGEAFRKQTGAFWVIAWVHFKTLKIGMFILN